MATVMYVLLYKGKPVPGANKEQETNVTYWEMIDFKKVGEERTHLGLCKLENTIHVKLRGLKRGYIEFKHYADAIHSGLTPPG